MNGADDYCQLCGAALAASDSGLFGDESKCDKCGAYLTIARGERDRIRLQSVIRLLKMVLAIAEDDCDLG